MLNLFGLNIDFAANGLEAINLLKINHYNLIFMDCQMPIMDGYQTTRGIRKGLSNPNIPIIAMTANAMRGDREICLNSGMSDYMIKPVDLERLELLLTRWLPESTRIHNTKIFHKIHI